jgi:hypothetical protein
MGYGLLCLNPDTAYGLEIIYWIVGRCTQDKAHSNFICSFSRFLLGREGVVLSLAIQMHISLTLTQSTDLSNKQYTVHLDTFLLMYVNYA